ncbi:hypothetical protein GCM10027344_03900 [Spelaeicoccus albus]
MSSANVPALVPIKASNSNVTVMVTSRLVMDQSCHNAPRAGVAGSGAAESFPCRGTAPVSGALPGADASADFRWGRNDQFTV